MAVIGQGHFAQVAVLPAIARLDDVELSALVSGSSHKLDELGERYGVRTRCSYDQLDELLASGGIDAVYIAVPNDLHAEMTLIAARHGVHVLCEKPMAPTEAECRQMIRACEARSVKLMIGYRLHFEVANLIAVELTRGGELGEARLFSSTFALQVREENIRVQARRGSGPLYDLGVYCINAARYLFRAEPVEVVAFRLAGRPRDQRFGHVEEAYSAMMRFSGERVAQFACSFDGHDRSHYEIVGTDGVIVLDNAYEYAAEMKMTIVGKGGERHRTFGKRDQVAAEIEYFARCVREGCEPEPSGWEGLADVRIVQALQSSARFGRAMTIESGGIERPRVRRPDLGQEITIAPHEDPELVDAPASSK